MTIETRNYIASPADVESLAAKIIDGDQQVTNARGTYLKALVATTQAEIGAAPRLRNSKARKLGAVEIAEHLKAFQTVFVRFHAAVVKVAENTVPDPDAAIIRQRTGFSRSAGSTVRGYIRAGNDIRALAAGRVTKRALATPATRRRVTAEVLKHRADLLVKSLEAIAKRMKPADAREAFAPLLTRIAEASGATERATRDAKKAIEERLPLRTKNGIFVPVNGASAVNGGHHLNA